jgi:hypothetical protein
MPQRQVTPSPQKKTKEGPGQEKYGGSNRKVNNDHCHANDRETVGIAFFGESL